MKPAPSININLYVGAWTKRTRTVLTWINELGEALGKHVGEDVGHGYELLQVVGNARFEIEHFLKNNNFDFERVKYESGA